MRRVVRAAYLGEKLGDISALENLASLDEIKRAARYGAPLPCESCVPPSGVQRTASPYQLGGGRSFGR